MPLAMPQCPQRNAVVNNSANHGFRLCRWCNDIVSIASRWKCSPLSKFSLRVPDTGYPRIPHPPLIWGVAPLPLLSGPGSNEILGWSVRLRKDMPRLKRGLWGLTGCSSS